MEENYIEEDVRKRLIIAGIREVEEHGITDFSLRRVAQLSGVSCAAPYRHFKSKDELIVEIIKYVNKMWDLLYFEICRIFGDDKERAICEVASSVVNFFTANKNYRAVILLNHGEESFEGKKHISSEIDGMVKAYLLSNGRDAVIAEQASYAVRALIYGTVLMAGNGEIDDISLAVEALKENIKRLISNDR